jgi:serine/threonine protein kinase
MRCGASLQTPSLASTCAPALVARARARGSREVLMHTPLQALHQKGIVHRDLKPQNVLLTDGNRAKVADMGLSKMLGPHTSSFDSLGGAGSSGWQAPEQIRALTPIAAAAAVLGDGDGDAAMHADRASGGERPLSSRAGRAESTRESSGGSGARSGGAAPTRQSKATDIFSLGLVLAWTLSRGCHPFGDSPYERDGNILLREPDLSPLADQPELHNLLRAMLQRCAPPPGSCPLLRDAAAACAMPLLRAL